MSLKYECKRIKGEGYYLLTQGVKVPVRIFMNPQLFEECEEDVFQQARAATEFPGVTDVVLTPDAHSGYVVPVGCVMATDGTLCQAPVGYDIGCFRADTLVPTVDGKITPIAELAARSEGLWVYAISADQRIVVAQATARKTRSAAPLVRVTLDSGREIVCTPDHQFMLRDGTYAAAEDLRPRRSLMPFYSRRSEDGYVTVRHPATGREQCVHWVMARQGLLGEIPAFPGQKTVIHHRNFSPIDNSPENLEFMGDRDHQVYHHKHGKDQAHFNGPEFTAARVAALAEKARTEEGHAYYAERGTRNLVTYMEERPEHFKAAVAGNGERGKRYLVAYNQSEKGRAKSKEIANRLYRCETCGEEVRSGVGLHNHRKYRHRYNHKVIAVVPLTETADVYCLTVPGYGNFALDAGVFVHNCGMAVLTSEVPKEKGLDERLRLKFSQEVMERVGMGKGVGSKYAVDEKRFNEIVRRGANALGYTRDNSERDYIPVDDDWEIPHHPLTRGIGQIGSLGGGNHFIELQHDQNGKLVVMIHTGSRGFGHGLASHFIDIGRRRLMGRKREAGGKKISAEAVYFEPDDKNWKGYKNAVAAGANFAIANRLIIMQEVSRAFRRVFGKEPELLYEISHNLAQLEPQPDGTRRWVHRKGATRALPPGHPLLRGSRWEETGHPILIPGSMGDTSYILYALPGAEKSLFSVNHGCGRRLSRKAAKDQFSQSGVNRQMKELNVLVNAGGNVPIDESPGCYKDAGLVIDSVVSAGLARVAYELTPIASLKGVD
jgi:tRNA-splicing ligase RtcB